MASLFIMHVFPLCLCDSVYFREPLTIIKICISPQNISLETALHKFNCKYWTWAIEYQYLISNEYICYNCAIIVISSVIFQSATFSLLKQQIHLNWIFNCKWFYNFPLVVKGFLGNFTCTLTELLKTENVIARFAMSCHGMLGELACIFCRPTHAKITFPCEPLLASWNGLIQLYIFNASVGWFVPTNQAILNLQHLLQHT